MFFQSRTVCGSDRVERNQDQSAGYTGFFDFVGEVEEAAAAADAAIIVVNGKAGVEVGTQKAWDICEKYNLPRMIWVTNMDDDNASFRQVVVDLQELYGKKIAPLHLPIRENGQFVGYVNVIQMKAKRWKEDGTVDKTDVPDYSFENLEICREALLESVAETSEDIWIVTSQAIPSPKMRSVRYYIPTYAMAVWFRFPWLPAQWQKVSTLYWMIL